MSTPRKKHDEITILDANMQVIQWDGEDEGETLPSIAKGHPEYDAYDDNQLTMPSFFKESSALVSSKDTVMSSALDTVVKSKDKISDWIVHVSQKNSQELLNMARRGATPVTTKVNFNFMGDNIIPFGDGFTMFDRIVHDAVCSLIQVGNTFTLGMISRAITGKSTEQGISKEQLAAIENSLKKCMYTQVTIDASEEVQLATKYQVEGFKRQAPLLSLEVTEVKAGGQICRAYRVNAVPLVYEYAAAKNQVQQFPLVLIDVPIVKRAQTIELIDYLLRRISPMKSDKTYVSKTILMDTVYKAMGILEAESLSTIKKRKMRIKKEMEATLKHFKKCNFIFGYDYELHNRAITRVFIFVTEQDFKNYYSIDQG